MKETSKRKRQSAEVIDLTNDQEETFPSSTGLSPIRKRLFTDDERDGNLTTGSVKIEPVAVDCLSINDDHIQYYRNNRELPMFSESSPNLEEIFNICLLHDVSKEKIVKAKPTRIKETATFVVQQNLINLKHPYDVEADDTPGSFIKRDQVRFYQATLSDDGELSLSTEVHVKKDRKGNIIGGTYNRRENGKWKSKAADLSKLYAVVRKRAVHKETLKHFSTSFTRYVIFVMSVQEYNGVRGNLTSLKVYNLWLKMIIIHYYFSSGNPVPIIPSKHGNATKEDTPFYRPTEHSVKQECKEAVKSCSRAPRLLAESIGDADVTILESTTDSSRVRNPKQVSNYKFNYGSHSKSNDEINDVILMLLEQNQESEFLILEENQPFVREVLFRHGCQPAIVAFTNQTLTDVMRFCTRAGSETSFSPLLADTTFNIAEYYFTQTAYQNLSLRKRDSCRHPWFPGPLLIHRNRATDDFKYFWQAVKRENPKLEGLHVICTDEDEALSGGILQETCGTIHLLGLEHVQDSVERKLTELNFPVRQRKLIQADIFGGPAMGEDGCLYDCESKEEFDEKSEAFKTKWERIERSSTQNNPPRFCKYFSRYKEKQIREKMAKYIRDRAGVPRGFGQNPVEWLHYMSKLEIDAEGDGVKHRDTSLTAAISSLKNRVMRLYQDATKALYGQGPYRLDEEYKKFSLDYDSWKDMSLEERKPVMKRFLTSVCCPPVLASRDNPVTTASDDETKSIQNNESASGVPSISKIPEVRRLSISADQFGIAEEILPNSTLRDMIRNAEALLNEPGAILPAASEDPRMRTVKSRLGKVPLIVKPSKTGNQLECQCSVYTAVGICQDTIAVAEDLDWLEKYAEVIRKKFLRKQGTGVNLTTAYNARKTLKEKGMKPDEIKKVARRKKKEMKESWQPSTPQPQPRNPKALRNTTSQLSSTFTPQIASSTLSHQDEFSDSAQRHLGVLIPNTMPTHCQQLQYLNENQNHYHPSLPQPSEPTLLLDQHQQMQQQLRNLRLQQAPQPHLPQLQLQPPPPQQQQYSLAYQPVDSTTVWHSGLSPHPYQICMLQNNVKKCYGCNQDFTQKYRFPPHNIVVRHTDRRIRGLDNNGAVQYGADFTNTYYHCDFGHIAKKNPYFDGTVYASSQLYLTPDQQSVIMAGKLKVKFC